ncbi:MAG: hypothetical protein KIT84_37035 [Labilithrix sp.]|nr:hypothetical protein [Labilithrix sp.]MCW5816663.1 hypothetical protein [Labilithrix sp.]
MIAPSLRRLTLLLGLALAAAPALAGCATDTGDDEDVESVEEPVTTVTNAELSAVARTRIDPNLRFDLLTRTGQNIMRASTYWGGVQDDYPRFPKARMCATNVSKVLFLAGITSYDQEGVRNLIADVRSGGGATYKMPQKKAEFIAKLNTIYGGHIPAGTLLAGMSIHSSNPGDQHVGFIGHTDRDGVVWIYHNNWYRPDNEGGARKPHMVSEANLRRGFPREWMATPWIKIKRNASGTVTDVTSMLPALDDMDPLNKDFQSTLAIPKEIVAEL